MSSLFSPNNTVVRWIALSATIPLLCLVGYYVTKKDDSETKPVPPSPRRPGLGSRALSMYTASPLSGWATNLGLDQPMVIATVGLPARGKSYITKMIIRYLQWNGFECKQFNVGSHRREKGMVAASSEFFDSSNKEAKQIREQLAMEVQDSMYEWLHESEETSKKRVAVFDATNTTIARRGRLIDRARQENVFLLFVESICNDEEILRKNYDLKLQNDDYRNIPAEVARQDFLQRVHAYEAVYETINDDEGDGQISYIQVINVGQKVIARNCNGYLPSQVAFYLQNVHIQPRKIFLVLTAESGDKYARFSERLAGAEGGKLLESGRQFSLDLLSFVKHEQEYNLRELGRELLVMTGTSKLQRETMEPLRGYVPHACHYTPLLNELRGGDLHGLSKAEMRSKYPVEFEKRERDKLRYRYPGVGGESYLDVMERLRPVIIGK
jgi:predicted kinase